MIYVREDLKKGFVIVLLSEPISRIPDVGNRDSRDGF
jgi:hypothetical protein